MSAAVFDALTTGRVETNNVFLEECVDLLWIV